MKKKLLFLVYSAAIFSCAQAQPFITIPPSGNQSDTACGGVFYDWGGASGNYWNNSNGMLTICPTMSGQYVSLLFTSFATEAANDVLTIYNGTSMTSPILSPSPLSGNLSCLGPLTSSDPSGCLTMRFFSNAANVQAGWTANISCSSTPTPLAAIGTDCSSALVIPSVPYSDSARCTQCMINDYTSQAGICNATYQGEDLVYRYTTTGPETDCITMSNTSGNPALAIYEGCPGAGGVCLTPTPMVGNNSMQFTFPSAGTYYIIIDETTAYSCYDLTITSCTVGINESAEEENYLSLSPNPATSELIVNSLEFKVESVEVYDVLGQKVYNSSLITHNSSLTIDVSQWHTGIYFVRVRSDEEMFTGKIVVSK